MPCDVDDISRKEDDVICEAILDRSRVTFVISRNQLICAAMHKRKQVQNRNMVTIDHTRSRMTLRDASYLAPAPVVDALE